MNDSATSGLQPEDSPPPTLFQKIFMWAVLAVVVGCMFFVIGVALYDQITAN